MKLFSQWCKSDTLMYWTIHVTPKNPFSQRMNHGSSTENYFHLALLTCLPLHGGLLHFITRWSVSCANKLAMLTSAWSEDILNTYICFLILAFLNSFWSFSSLCQFVAEKNLAAASHLGGWVGGTLFWNKKSSCSINSPPTTFKQAQIK